MAKKLTHVDAAGTAQMVDVSGKVRTRRRAVATGKIRLAPTTVTLIRDNQIQKGDVLTVAKIAGIMGAKETSRLIPLCHQVEIEHVDVSVRLVEDGVDITAHAACTDKTGIEMEALTAVSVAALTVYDMCKAVDHEMEIGTIRLVEKTTETVPPDRER